MTGFDETVPPDSVGEDEDEPTAHESADDDRSRPEHDSAVPALEDDPEPDEPGGT